MEIEGLLRWLAKRYEPTFRRLRCGGYEDAYQTAWVAYLQALPIVEDYVKGTKVIIKQKPRSEWRHGKEFND